MAVLESFIIVFFLLLFNGGRRKKSINILGTLAAGILLSINVMLTTYTQIFNEYTVPMDIVITLIFSGIILRFRATLIIISISLCYILLIAGNFISLQIISLCAGVPLEEIYQWDVIYSLVLIISKILWVSFLGILLYVKKKLNIVEMTFMEKIIVFSMGCITVISVTMACMTFSQNSSEIMNFENLFIGFILILDGFIFWLLVIVMVQKRKNLEINYLRKHVEDQKSAYQDLLNNLNDIKKQRHNISNALVALDVLAQKEDYGSLALSIKQTIQEFTDFGGSIPEKENNMWTAIIDYKKQAAREKNILFKENIECGDYSCVRGVDLCVILGNLLDNAIEAEIKEPVHKEIRLIGKNDFGIVYFCVKNYIGQTVLGANSDLKSTKAHSTEHGYGLKTVRELAHAYNGEVKIYEKDYYFCVEVFLFQLEANQKL